MTTKKKRAIEKQADLSAVDWRKLERDIFAEIERRRFAATLGCGERPPAMVAEAGLKIDFRPRGKKKPRRIAPAGGRLN